METKHHELKRYAVNAVILAGLIATASPLAVSATQSVKGWYADLSKVAGVILAPSTMPPHRIA